MESTLRMRLLGGFSLEHRGAPITIASPRLQALLAYLALHAGEVQPRRRLAFLLWPDSSEAQAQTNLRTVLHRTQVSFPDISQLLQIDTHTIVWSPDHPVVLDVAEFRSALHRGAAAEIADDQSSAIEALDHAAATYVGDLLPDCYDDWTQPVREHLRTDLLNALARLAMLLERRRDYIGALASARRLAQLDPLNEATYLTLIRLHALCGDRSGALRVYHACATTLQQELGVLPGAALRGAYEQLLAAEAPAEQTVAASTPLIGRQVVWQRMQAVWRAASAGRPLLLMLAGEAGIGKTHLAEEFLRWVARQGGITAVTQCYPAEGQLAYAPAVAWLRSDALRARLSQLNPMWLVELSRLDPELLMPRRELPSPAPLSEAWQRQRLFEALARAVLAAGRPTVLLIDDLQWCDRDTLEWLHYLLRFDAGARLLVVGTARDEGCDPAHPLTTLLAALRREDRIVELSLDPLSAAESAELAGHMVGHALSSEQAARIFGETEGNPLFIVEMMRADSAGAIPADTGGLGRAGPFAGNLELPAGVQAVLTQRLQQVSSRTRTLLDVAAVIGRSFTVDVLARAVELSEDELMYGLDELWQRRIVREQGTSAYNFTHDKLRAAAYVALSPVRRRQLHSHVAAALEAAYTINPDIVSGQIAAHYEHAGMLERAAAYERRAAEVAHRLYANLDAIEHFRRALVMLGSIHLPEAAAIHSRMGDLFHLLGRYDDARQAWARAQVGLPAEDHIARAHVLRKIGNAFRDEYHYMDAKHSYDAAETMLPPTLDLQDERVASAWVQIQLERITMHYWLGEVEIMLGLVEQVRPLLERTGDPAQRARLHQISAIALLRRGRYTGSPEAVAHAHAYLNTVVAVQDSLATPAAHFQLGFALLWADDLANAEQHISRALELAECSGDRSLQGRCLTYLTIIARRCGDVNRTQLYTTRSLDIADANQMHDYIGAAHGNLGWLAWRAGNLDMVREHGRAALAAWRQLPAGYICSWTARWPLIGAALEEDNAVEAVEHTRALLDERQQRPPSALEATLDAAVRAAELGDLATAQTLLMAALAPARDLGYL